MSEETRKLSAFEAFQKTQITFAEAEEKAKLEAGAPKVERFRIGEDGEYTIRILPLAPNFDSEGNILPMEHKGYEYGVHQFFLKIKGPTPKNGKKPKIINIPVVRTTDKEVGMSVDIIDTYLKVAKEIYADDADLMELLSKNSYEGGIRWDYPHAMMVLDLSSDKARAKGPQLWQCTHSQYKNIDSAKMRLWKELYGEGQETCPISGFTNAYPVKVIRTNKNKKTEYTFEIGRKTVDIKEEEAEKLLSLPRINEQIYYYSRYMLEATLVYLQQFDEEHDMEVCKEPDFIEAVEKLKGELPADDTTHFDLNAASSKGTAKDEVTIESLYAEYDAIADQDLGEKSDEYQDLREKIRQFIEDKQLDVRISRTKNNLQMLEEIEEALDSQPAKSEKKEPEEAPVPAPARRRAPKPKAVESEEESEETEESEDEQPAAADEPEEDEAPAPAPARRHRARPGSEEAEAESAPAEDAAEEEAPAEDAVPARRTRARRLR